MAFYYYSSLYNSSISIPDNVSIVIRLRIWSFLKFFVREEIYGWNSDRVSGYQILELYSEVDE